MRPAAASALGIRFSQPCPSTRPVGCLADGMASGSRADSRSKAQADYLEHCCTKAAASGRAHLPGLNQVHHLSRRRQGAVRRASSPAQTQSPL